MLSSFLGIYTLLIVTVYFVLLEITYIAYMVTHLKSMLVNENLINKTFIYYFTTYLLLF